MRIPFRLDCAVRPSSDCRAVLGSARVDAGTGAPVNAAPVVITPNPGVVSANDYRTTVVPDGMLTGVSRRWTGTEAANADGSLKAGFISAVEAHADYLDGMGLKLWPAILIYQNQAAPYVPAGMAVSFTTCGATESAPGLWQRDVSGVVRRDGAKHPCAVG